MRSRFIPALALLFGLFIAVTALVSAQASRVVRQGHPTETVARWRPIEGHLTTVSDGAEGSTLLDEVGELKKHLASSEVASWRNELHRSPVKGTRAAWLHLWLGEYELAQRQEPLRALYHFRRPQQLVKPIEAVYGLAAYDIAVTTLARGAYAEAATAFRRLLAPKSRLRGFDSRQCALMLRHASACAGYHAARAAMGITEPTHLDPLCGVEALAACLRALDEPYDRTTLLRACRVTGIGSTTKDLLDGCAKLGVVGRAIRADEHALMRLPMPMVAFVEHDHYVAIVRADQQGVSYLCSDCGGWPGGRRDLSWKQWKAMEPGLYLAVSKPGSRADRLFTELSAREQRSATGVRLAANGPIVGLGSQVARADLIRLAALLRGHVLLYGSNPPATKCGGKPDALPCDPAVECPTDPPSCGCGGGGAGGSGGGSGDGGTGGGASGPSASLPVTGAGAPNTGAATEGDPVNLATGEEEYHPAPDLAVYNPHGPAIVWQRQYRSLRGPNPDLYQANDLGIGWSHPYNIWVTAPGGASMIPQVSPDIYSNFVKTGTDIPPVGITWDVLLNGTTVASSAVPNGWIVNFFGAFSVKAAATATIANNYEVRYKGGYGMASAYFDVAEAGAGPRGATAIITPSGTEAPPTGMVWEILQGGVTLATSADPRGWKATYTASGYYPNSLQVRVPISTPIGTGYKLRYRYQGSQFFSGYFSVRESRYLPKLGTRYLYYPNGARIALTPSAIPTAAQPSVSCSVPSGYPLKADWIYDAADPAGRYRITFSDGSRWITTTPLRSTPSTFVNNEATLTLQQSLGRLEDRNGNALLFYYSTDLPIDGFPVLASIADAATNSTLLTLHRATDGTANLLGVSDAYGRSVYYSILTYASDIDYPYGDGLYRRYQELTQVSQIVPTGTAVPPVRWSYGYQMVRNNFNELIPYLSTLTVPSATGTGTATATIYYADYTGYVTHRVDANGNRREYSSPDPSHTTVTVKNPLGAVVYTFTVGYDSHMNETTRTDGAGTVVSSRTYADPSTPYAASTVLDGNGRSTQFTYDQYGHVQTITNPRGTVTTVIGDYTAWPMGRIVSSQTGTKTPLSLTYYEPSGLVQTVTEARPGTSGSTTVTSGFTYDALGNLLTSTGPGNNATALTTTTFNYMVDGAYSQAAAVRQPLIATDNLGHSAHFRYDARGNLLATWDALGNETDLTYNLADQPLTVTRPATGQTGIGRAVTQYVYLYPGGPLATVNQFDESSLLVRQVNYTYGPEGELLGVTGSTEPVTYVYDALYRLKELRDGKNQATVYAYHASGYLASVTYPGGDTVQYSNYDNIGNLGRRVDGRGIQTDYLYADAAGALTDIRYPATPALNVQFAYDSYGRCTTTTDSTGSHSYTYDDRDEITSVATTYTGLPARTISYAFYPDGSRQSMSTPAGTFSYSYDAAGRTTGITNPFSESFAWTYLNNDWLKTQTLGNGAESTYWYNALGQLTDLENRSAVGGPLLSHFSNLLHDGAGNRTALTATLTAAPQYDGQTAYGYDGENQLLQEQTTRAGGYTHVFGYDAAGNPTTFKGLTRAYNVNNQDTVNVYDSSGNPTTYQGVGMTYDPESRLTAVGTTLTAGYRSDGLRAWKQTAAGRTYFLYDGEFLLAELDATGSVTTVNTWGAAGLVSRRAGGSSVFYTFDPQGSVSERLDGTAAVLTSHVWDAHGIGQSTGVTTDPFGYKGQGGYYHDSETGFLLLTHRYYDPSSGRFLNRDPIGYQGGVNVYAYVNNSPITRADPSGLASIWNNEEPDGTLNHTFIVFEQGCKVKGKSYKSFGLYPFWNLDEVTGKSIHTPDGGWGETTGKVRKRNFNDEDFNDYLCACINISIIDNPLWRPGYMCTEWAYDMWRCAKDMMNGKDRYPEWSLYFFF